MPKTRKKWQKPFFTLSWYLKAYWTRKSHFYMILYIFTAFMSLLFEGCMGVYIHYTFLEFSCNSKNRHKMVIFQNFSFIFLVNTIYILHLVSKTDIRLSSKPKINIWISQFQKKFNFQKKIFTIFTFAKNVHTCPPWILMGKYLMNIYRNVRKIKFRPEVALFREN